MAGKRRPPPEPERRPPSSSTLAARVRELEGISWERARELCRAGKVDVDGATELDPASRPAPGATVAVHASRPRRSAGALDPARIVYVDRDVVVVDKPPGVITVPYEPGDRDTLVDLTRVALRRLEKGYDPELGVVHRLDKHTSGVMVFTRTFAAKRDLGQQFREHTVERAYLAIAHGDCRSATHESHLVADRGDGLRGSHGRFRRARGGPPTDARRAVTHITRLSGLRGATLVECRLETGRQHQIRIHLAEAGHPLVGELVYVRDYREERIAAPRPMLHARTLGFTHPRTHATMRFDSALPADFVETLVRLGGSPPTPPA
jgi:23S rRNA pseudouridine1911/1915/1917 synthase